MSDSESSSVESVEYQSEDQDVEIEEYTVPLTTSGPSRKDSMLSDGEYNISAYADELLAMQHGCCNNITKKRSRKTE